MNGGIYQCTYDAVVATLIDEICQEDIAGIQRVFTILLASSEYDARVLMVEERNVKGRRTKPVLDLTKARISNRFNTRAYTQVWVCRLTVF